MEYSIEPNSLHIKYEKLFNWTGMRYLLNIYVRKASQFYDDHYERRKKKILVECNHQVPTYVWYNLFRNLKHPYVSLREYTPPKGGEITSWTIFSYLVSCVNIF